MLDRTAFYPGGGGQPNDVGVLAGLNVVKVRKAGDEVLHILDGDLPTVGNARAWRNQLGSALSVDADSYRHAYFMRMRIPRLWRAGHWRRYGTAQGPHGF